ncbi:hypothetical protein [Arcticibacter tournemirensis]|uniref:Uncharacterized protein n=1 Tax=Arcticibacter tournemirensis TaxID=699437 RepID=A0A4Q0MFA7_9SPHI|nr:hypothetical protein [Arcticibacter tournemirensis]RXF71964.1 hypothetical protein EKH83_04590 [Arcticibacter tournemirensis]
MQEHDELGKYLQKKVREKRITDKVIANFLNISEKTVPKIYPLKDISSERLSKFCILLDEDLFSGYYGEKEPLKSILTGDKLVLENEVDRLKKLNKENETLIEFLKTELSVKSSTIKILQNELLEMTGEILKVLKDKKK